MSLTKARELAVLSIVIAHPVHGYQIASAFEKGPLQLLGLQRAAVYSILARFAKRGWIVEKEERLGGYPDRRVSYVTQAGCDAVEGLIKAGGGLAQTPLMSLMMLHDSGIDVFEAARRQLEKRKALIADLSKTDAGHGETFSHRLAYASITAEVKIIERLLRTELGPADPET